MGHNMPAAQLHTGPGGRLTPHHCQAAPQTHKQQIFLKAGLVLRPDAEKEIFLQTIDFIRLSVHRAKCWVDTLGALRNNQNEDIS